jgi:hypothetical protein
MSNENQNNLPFRKKNYYLMLVGLAVLAVGYIIMTMDKEPYGFGFMGLTLGPIIVFLGFLIEFVAIMYKPKN